VSKAQRKPGLLTPELSARLSALQARAAEVADGLWGGSHRSAKQGASVVFVERRAYSPGDDPRLLDWRALARTDKPSLKRFEEEAELEVQLLLDRSASMAWRHDHDQTKLQHGALLLGALAFILSRQRDRVGLGFVDARYEPVLPASSQPGQAATTLRELAAVEPVEGETDLAAALLAFADRSRRKALVVLASDLLDPRGVPQDAMRVLRARGHELRVLHVLDPAELEFPFDAPRRFHGLEGEADLEADARRVRAAYLEQVTRFLADARDAALSAQTRYTLARTDARPEETLADALMQSPRAARRRAWA